MNLTIPALTYVDYHCQKCGHQHESTSEYTCMPVKCAECGGDNQRGFKVLPTNRAWRDEHPMRYDLCSTNKDVQVYLMAATGERGFMTMPEEYVPDCDEEPIEVARAVLKVCETKYLYTSSKNSIIAVIAAMEKCQAMSDANAKSNRINKLRKIIACAVYEYESLTEQEEGAV